MAISIPSINDLSPIESGGVVARKGFTFQDHVAAGFCLEMLHGPDVIEVWCETQDDITLIHRIDAHNEVEFVQVKSDEMDQLWSIARICERKKKESAVAAGTSILERSLAYDRVFSEPRSFRLVTARPTAKDLEVLTLPLSSPGRCKPDADDLVRIKAEVHSRLNGIKSANGNGVEFWLSHALWEVRHSVESVKNKNLLVLQGLADARGGLTAKQGEDVYDKLLLMVQDAAQRDWEIDPQAKKIKRDKLNAWLDSIIKDMAHSYAGGAGTDMQRKMEKALISEDYILTAHEERRRYRSEILDPKYLDLSDRNLVEGEVLAELQHLRLELDSGNLPEGFEFYKVCQAKIKELQTSLQTNTKPPLFFLDGCMHTITDRCSHRYMKESHEISK